MLTKACLGQQLFLKKKFYCHHLWALQNLHLTLFSRRFAPMAEGLQCHSWGEHPFLGRGNLILCQTLSAAPFHQGVETPFRTQGRSRLVFWVFFWVQPVPQWGNCLKQQKKNYTLEMRNVKKSGWTAQMQAPIWKGVKIQWGIIPCHSIFSLSLVHTWSFNVWKKLSDRSKMSILITVFEHWVSWENSFILLIPNIRVEGFLLPQELSALL